MTDVDDQNSSREAKIREILEQEVQNGEDLANEARKMIGYLLRDKKGYGPEDVRRGLAFEVTLGQEAFWSSADFLVSVNGRMGMIIKCAAGSLDSRERQAVAAARVIASPPLPVAVVADPVTAEVLDVASGEGSAGGHPETERNAASRRQAAGEGETHPARIRRHQVLRAPGRGRRRADR
jgi:hypothetical protein